MKRLFLFGTILFTFNAFGMSVRQFMRFVKEGNIIKMDEALEAGINIKGLA